MAPYIQTYVSIQRYFTHNITCVLLILNIGPVEFLYQMRMLLKTKKMCGNETFHAQDHIIIVKYTW